MGGRGSPEVKVAEIFCAAVTPDAALNDEADVDVVSDAVVRSAALRLVDPREGNASGEENDSAAFPADPGPEFRLRVAAKD